MYYKSIDATVFKMNEALVEYPRNYNEIKYYNYINLKKNVLDSTLTKEYYK